MALLKQPGFNKKAANKLDELLTSSMLAAEKKFKITYRIPWFKETHRIITTLYIINTLSSSLNTNKNFSEVINKKIKTLSTPFELPRNVHSTKKEIQKVQKKAKQFKKEKLADNSEKFQERENSFIQAHTQMSKTKAKLFFCTGETAKKLMKSLPSTKKCHLGQSMKILVLLPLEGTKLCYMPIKDGKTI